MRKSDVFNLVARASAIFLVYDCALKAKDIRYSMTEATVQLPYGTSTVKQASLSHLGSQDQTSYTLTPVGTSSDGSDADSNAQSDFSRRIHGGSLVRFDFGLIVVQAAEQPESLQPTALTTDAIITSSLRSKIAAQPQLRSQTFRIRTDNGVVKIDALEESLDQAAVMINIALTVPDVRQIVYTMPASV
jgi:hypothetical protein